MALAASACLMTHPANYSGKGSSLGPLFGNVFVLLASHRVICCLPSPAKTGSGFRELSWSSGKVKTGDYSEIFFPRSPGSGRGNHNLLPRLRVTSGPEPHGPKNHRGSDQCHSTRMNMRASS